uniref:Uncharacterized protein n=1 Tax=Anguilla anguilla TaxID=7936 RepID=A0A0E9WMI7_ANGAN
MPFIIYTCLSWSGTRGLLEPIPACIWRYTPWTGCHTHHPLIPMVNLESPVSLLTCLWTVGGHANYTQKGPGVRT